MRCTVAALTAAPLLTVAGTAAHAAPAAGPDTWAAAGPAGVAAKSAYLYDVSAKKARWARADKVRRPIGSMTKVMTAYTVLNSGVSLDKVITIQRKHVEYVTKQHTDASRAGLVVGDKLTVRQLLNLMMVPSGCDAAYVLADTVGPGWQKFVGKMNANARKLGMKNSHFANFDGLNWPSESSTYSTAWDMTRLGYFTMKNANFRAVVKQPRYLLGATSAHHAYYPWNTNRLLGSGKGAYKGAIGIKTGHTNAAGFSLMFEATRGKKTLIGVVMDSSKTVEMARFTDAAKVLNWGFGVRSADVWVVPPVPAGANVD
ncbi:D-alanyl-D-alanine carboxypeptidase family protein [Actinomadura rupiterrae]|uniref:D-alanyl-D-alanine carboxypeptidase family protein n=1 Tax=Actinomadura rupiterrae TaxID=559627 RepID=UPI0020A60E00|nr:serine hydrolase [Actinomadura rupiterrae]MCP2338378.1 D-alanyl-D-alanine carboxypeptidase (penicillin-binding protein 5/6) [Actinomadura rupiterrae]